MIVLLQNYKYNCPCFYITNKQIDTVSHDNTCDSHEWKKLVSL